MNNKVSVGISISVRSTVRLRRPSGCSLASPHPDPEIIQRIHEQKPNDDSSFRGRATLGRQDRRVVGVLDDRVDVGEQLLEPLDLVGAIALGERDEGHGLHHLRGGATGRLVVLHLTARVLALLGDLDGELLDQLDLALRLFVAQDRTVQADHLATRQGDSRPGVGLGDPLLEGGELHDCVSALLAHLREVVRSRLRPGPARGLAEPSGELGDAALELLRDAQALRDGPGVEVRGRGGRGHVSLPVRLE